MFSWSHQIGRWVAPLHQSQTSGGSTGRSDSHELPSGPCPSSQPCTVVPSHSGVGPALQPSAPVDEEKRCPLPQLRFRRIPRRFPKLVSMRHPSTPRPEVEAKPRSSDLGFSSSFSSPGSYLSPCSSLLFDIGLRFTPAHFTVDRTCITTSGPDSDPTSVRRPSSVPLASGFTPEHARVGKESRS